MLIGFVRKCGERDYLPVDLDRDVIPDIIAMKVCNEIFYFHDPEMDTGSLRGHHVSECIPWNDETTKVHATISYGRGTNEMIRLVSCKEMLHLLDPKSCLTSSVEEIDYLISKIALPQNLVDPTDGHQVLTDRMVIILALAVLFPMRAREILLPAYVAGKISLERIADDAELPPEYVATVLHDSWPDAISAVLKGVEMLESIKGK